MQPFALLQKKRIMHCFISHGRCHVTQASDGGRTDHGAVKLDLGLGLSADDGQVSLRLQLARLADVVTLVGQLGRVDDQLVLAAAQVLDLDPEQQTSEWLSFKPAQSPPLIGRV